MALYDNPLWILSHVRNSFVVSDDTGNSELVIGGDDHPESVRLLATSEALLPFLELEPPEADGDNAFRPTSLEIRAGANPLGYRPRCNTEIKLEKLKRDRKNAPNIRTVSWRPPSSDLSEEDLEKLFPKKDLPHCPEPIFDCPAPASGFRSLLSMQLDSSQDVGINFFSDFGQFCGESDDDSKSIRVYLSMCSKEVEGSLPYLQTKVKSTAKVYQVIGYLCYLYTKQKRQPSLIHNVDSFSLYLAEDGAVEWDLPPLEFHEMISRYGFTDFAIVEAQKKRKADFSFKVTLPDGTFTVVQLASKSISLQDLMDKAMAKRRKFGQVDKFQYTYNLERSDSPGTALDLSSMLSGIDTNQFFVVRQNSRRFVEQGHVDDTDDTNCMNSVEAGAYKEYTNLKLVTKIRTKVPVVFAISEEKLEILPHQSYGSSLQMWSAKVQSRLVRFEDVVACQVLDRQGHFIIVVIFRHETTFNKLKLECSEDSVAKEIWSKIKFLMRDVSTDAQKQYKLFRERKIHRRKTIHF